MQILYLITSDVSARFLRGQLGHLVGVGHSVTVATRWSEPPASVDAGVATVALPFEREPSPVHDFRTFVAAVRLMRRLRPDVVNASTPKAALIGILAAWVCRVRTRIYVVRGLRFETMAGWRRRAMCAIERLTTACATDVIYNSPSLRTVAERESAVRGGRGVVLGGGSGNGVDIDRYRVLEARHAARARFGLPAGARVLGFVGRLTNDKGIDDVVGVFLDLPPDCWLLLVGEFEDGDPVATATREVIVRHERIVHVRWTEDPTPAYRAMDVLVFPSHREGLPNVPLEAQLCDVPVVAYAATGTVDAVMPSAPNRLVQLHDRRALQEAVALALAAEHSNQAAREWVIERFDQRRLWDELTRVVEARA